MREFLSWTPVLNPFWCWFERLVWQSKRYHPYIGMFRDFWKNPATCGDFELCQSTRIRLITYQSGIIIQVLPLNLVLRYECLPVRVGAASDLHLTDPAWPVSKQCRSLDLGHTYIIEPMATVKLFAGWRKRYRNHENIMKSPFITYPYFWNQPMQSVVFR